jgi:hypothetical protein
MSKPRSFKRLWGAPIALATLTLFGLLASLLGTGAWHLAAWAALAVPVGVGVYFMTRRRLPRPAR